MGLTLLRCSSCLGWSMAMNICSRFSMGSQEEYLTIVAQWLSSFGVDAPAIAAARPASLVWALERGSRSGRVAYQFARDYAGTHSGS